jgi:hypothetical protein
VLLVAVEATLVAWAHALGVAWSTLAAELAGLLLLGVAALVYVVRVPRAVRRYERQLAAALDAHAAETGRQPHPLAPSAPADPRTVVTSETA